MVKISVIAAVDKNNVIGLMGDIPWHIPEDLQHFRDTVKDHIIICGRKTAESLPKKYHNKDTIVISSKKWLDLGDCIVANSLFTAIGKAKQKIAQENKPSTIYIAGGGTIYKDAVLLADELIITYVKEVHTGDTFFPEVQYSNWKATDVKRRPEFNIIYWRRK